MVHLNNQKFFRLCEMRSSPFIQSPIFFYSMHIMVLRTMFCTTPTKKMLYLNEDPAHKFLFKISQNPSSSQTFHFSTQKNKLSFWRLSMTAPTASPTPLWAVATSDAAFKFLANLSSLLKVSKNCWLVQFICC